MRNAIDSVVIHPDPVLRATCAAAGEINEGLRELADRLKACMVAAGGIGLAAPQIGVSKRACAVGMPSPSGLVPVVMFDPEIIWHSATVTTMAEGCLSIPGKRFLVPRPHKVKVRYRDVDGNETVVAATGLLAKCVQHEIDHLDGILILDLGEEVAPGTLHHGSVKAS